MFVNNCRDKLKTLNIVNMYLMIDKKNIKNTEISFKKKNLKNFNLYSLKFIRIISNILNHKF